MKTQMLLCWVAGMLLTASCGSAKKETATFPYAVEWELEYLSGPRIAFEGLFPDRKPVIAFERETGRVAGNSGCNGYTAPFERDGHSIRFGEPGPSTLMYCGDGEEFFRNTMRKVERWDLDSEGRLNLLIGEVPMMRFHRKATP